MSGWRNLVRELFAQGGSVPHAKLVGYETELSRLRALGLAKTTGKPGWANRWSLTPLGFDFCEGRVAPRVYRGPARGAGGTKFLPTWLSALPRPNTTQPTP